MCIESNANMSSFWLFWLLVLTAKAELEMLAIASATNVFFMITTTYIY
ncbi:hypothetical protein VCR14J2_410019 [Vibrio coralliirubri]|uniref:Uncharacterized protein n=1 Tax=Vibrio coralliirubri TaxID=1516159 RepID=A0AA86XR56_9VIBR|nr:hypothetical protein VCR31J2_1310190 [Vibrio coralliirubri]CDU06430.1 hypothetical protein VCR14J2_410019 [Vibrio coralliirubri]